MFCRKDGMNWQEDGQNCHCKTTSGSSDTSIYSTCSNSANDSQATNGDNLQNTVCSAILAGQNIRRASVSKVFTEESFLESNYTINPLDLNLGILEEDSDLYLDCQNENQSSDSHESSKYFPVEAVSKLTNKNTNNYANSKIYDRLYNNSDEQRHVPRDSPLRKNNEQDKLLTILEETERTRTTNSLVTKDVSDLENTGDVLAAFASQVKNDNRVSTKRVLFANTDNIKSREEGRNQSKLKQKTPALLASKKQYYPWNKKSVDENSNKHNTTESFVMWEKYCESLENCNVRKSCSYSELNTSLQSYEGDNEYSASFRSLDDTYINQGSINSLSENEPDSKRQSICNKKRASIYRSKSCETLLKEVKHLPHILYDKFLKCLAEEIEHMRKQKVYCTCKNNTRKIQNKENNKKINQKNVLKPTILLSYCGEKKENNLTSKNKAKLSPEIVKSPVKLQNKKLSPEVLKSRVNFQNKSKFLSPELLTNSSNSNNIERLSAKSPNKTPLSAPKRKFCWHKEIVSPVGEYIRGKSPSPYKHSPNKKKL